MTKGTVKFYNEAKGFGFITPETGGDDIFVHATSIVGSPYLNEDDKVEYEIGEGQRGPCAVNVKKL